MKLIITSSSFILNIELFVYFSVFSALLKHLNIDNLEIFLPPNEKKLYMYK
jgi:hypothetical protein